jgi:hypothetical protein
MFEIITTITDEYGTRTVPTGIASYSRAALVLELAGLARRHPGQTFAVEAVIFGDEFNAY